MKNTLIVIGIIFIGGIAGFTYSQKDVDVQVPVDTTMPVPGASSDVVETVVKNDGGPGSIMDNQSVATYTDQGFSPKSITVKKGGTVTFTNNSTHGMWVAVAMHPTHDAYDGTAMSEHCLGGAALGDAFDQCHVVEAGESWSYTFTKAGSWNYHNHYRALDSFWLAYSYPRWHCRFHVGGNCAL